MALILHIDTALQQANIGIAKDGELMLQIQNSDQYNHASFVQPAIQQVLQQLGISINSIDAIGITAGPGSYTGLRVAMASAKGLCYALQKPLLAVGTLEVMTVAAVEKFPEYSFYCPMIDARRDEVYTAAYTARLEIEMAPQPLILDNHSYKDVLAKGKTLFWGSGSEKYRDILNFNINAFFEQPVYDGKHIAQCLFNSFKNKDFENLAYSEPAYLKGFYDHKTLK